MPLKERRPHLRRKGAASKKVRQYRSLARSHLAVKQDGNQAPADDAPLWQWRAWLAARILAHHGDVLRWYPQERRWLRREGVLWRRAENFVALEIERVASQAIHEVRGCAPRLEFHLGSSRTRQQAEQILRDELAWPPENAE